MRPYTLPAFHFLTEKNGIQNFVIFQNINTVCIQLARTYYDTFNTTQLLSSWTITSSCRFLLLPITVRNTKSTRQMTAVGSEDSGETLNRHGETRNGPDANDLSSTTEKKDSRSYATVVRGTKRFVRFE